MKDGMKRPYTKKKEKKLDFSFLTPSKYHHKKGFKDTKIEIKIQNKDKTGQGFDLWSCL